MRTATTPLVELEVIELYRIDGHAELLVPIGAVGLSSSGVLALGQSQDGRVVFFDSSDGRFLGSVGRRGEGPGEFRTISEISWVGDTLWIYDRLARRFSFAAVTPATVSHPAQMALSLSTISVHDLAPSHPVAVYPGRSMLVRMEQSDLEYAHAPRDTDLFIRMTFNQDVVNVIAELAADPEEVVVTSNDGRSVSSFPVPWVLPNHFAVAPDPTRLLAVRTESSSPPRVTIVLEVFGPQGGLQLTSSLALTGVNLPEAVADSVVQARAEGISGSARRRFPEHDLPRVFRNAVVVPEVYPVVASAVLANSGGVWLQVAQARAMEPETYVWIDESGDAVGKLLLRQGRIVAAQGNLLWVEERDPLGVESIVKYEVTR